MKEFLKVVGLTTLIGAWFTIAGRHSEELHFIVYALIIAPPYLALTHLVDFYFKNRIKVDENRLRASVAGVIRLISSTKGAVKEAEVCDPDLGTYLIKKIK